MNSNDKQLLDDILSAQNEFETARRNFDNAVNPDLVEMYSYKIIAARCRCDYLIKKAKSSGLINSFSPARDIPYRKFQR